MSLTFSEYSKLARATNVCPDAGVSTEHTLDGNFIKLPVYETMGVAGEAGEALEKVKKGWRDGVFDLVGYVKELGDTLWYISSSAEKVGFTLEEVAEININKLRSRHERDTIHGEGDNR